MRESKSKKYFICGQLICKLSQTAKFERTVPAKLPWCLTPTSGFGWGRAGAGGSPKTIVDFDNSLVIKELTESLLYSWLWYIAGKAMSNKISQGNRQIRQDVGGVLRQSFWSSSLHWVLPSPGCARWQYTQGIASCGHSPELGVQSICRSFIP